MSQPLRVAAFGCGLAAKYLHVPVITALPGADLVGLHDLDLDAARSLALAAGGDPVVYEDPAQLLAAAKPDIVLVLTPTVAHESLAVLALEAGAHVLVEKPFTDSAASARRMRDTALRCGRQLSVVHNELFTPGMSELRARLARAEIGNVSSVHYITSSRNQRYVPDPWYFEARGGRIGETLPHALCVLDELLPDLEVVAVRSAQLGKAILPDWAKPDLKIVDDLRVELATRDEQQLGSIWYSMNSWIPTCVLVAGSEGNLLAYPFGSVTTIRSDAPPISESIRSLGRSIKDSLDRQVRRLRRGRPTTRIEATSHYQQLTQFCEAIRMGHPARPDATSACRVTASWEAIIDQIEERQPSHVKRG